MLQLTISCWDTPSIHFIPDQWLFAEAAGFAYLDARRCALVFVGARDRTRGAALVVHFAFRTLLGG